MARTRNLFIANSKEAFKLSRSKLELFISCQRCFYIDRKLGISQPGGLTFSLNDAVDGLLKKEFDIYRAKGISHPVMVDNNINAVPYAHSEIETWRNNFKGIHYHHKATNFLVYGAIDDVWVTKDNVLIIADYKAVSTEKGVSLEEDYRQGYKRQVEIYQWLFRQNGFTVSDTAYFIFANARKDRDSFNSTLHFDIQVIEYKGNADWVEQAIMDAYNCLISDTIAEANQECKLCAYINEIQGL